MLGAMSGAGVNWEAIDVVLLDMDGTLIDLHFDNTLWNQRLPEHYAAVRGLSQETARAELGAHMVRNAHTIDFYCLDYWANVTELDIMGLHRELGELLRFRPGTLEFLTWLAGQPQQVVLTTNAHRHSIDFKHEVLGLLDHVDQVVSSHDFREVKESQPFWQRMQQQHGFDAGRALFIDDHERVLDAAAAFGIGELRWVATPDLKRPTREAGPYTAIDNLSELIP